MPSDSHTPPLPAWWPGHPPIFDIHRTWRDNIAHGPSFDAPLPMRQWPAEGEWVDFLGYRVASRLGVPAGPLLDSQWISLAGQLGFDIPVYKTIRSFGHDAHPLPNVLYVDTDGPLTRERAGGIIHAAQQPPKDLDHISITNSFGNPSLAPEYLMQDIAKAKASLARGQALVVSVFGTEHDGINPVDDFVLAANLAKEAGAEILEANFSCPNVSAADGALYQSPDQVSLVAKRLTNAIGHTPLILKMGTFASKEQMRASFLAAARAGARAIAGINTVGMRVVDANGASALGPKRPTGGICGAGIRAEGLAWTREARDIISCEKLDLTLIGMGGVMAPEHCEEYLKAGADIVMTATGMMWDPYLAARYHQRQG